MLSEAISVKQLEKLLSVSVKSDFGRVPKHSVNEEQIFLLHFDIVHELHRKIGTF